MRWKKNQVFSVKLRQDIWAIGQMLDSPFILTFNVFKSKNDWGEIDLKHAPTLFCCSVLKQFFTQSETQLLQVNPIIDYSPPKVWIKRFIGNRMFSYTISSTEKIEFITAGGDPGGLLIEYDIEKGGYQGEKVLNPDISLSSDEIIDKFEMQMIWNYPHLNERLFLCYKLGKNVDPFKDVSFGRPMRPEYYDWLRMLGQKVTPESLGY